MPALVLPVAPPAPSLTRTPGSGSVQFEGVFPDAFERESGLGVGDKFGVIPPNHPELSASASC